MTSLANALEPSSCAAAPEGPNTAMPRARTTSATPATSGASGPTTTRSAPSDSARSATDSPESGSTSWSVATAAMPGFPGAACTAPTPGSSESARASACSRPPVPMTRQVRGDELTRRSFSAGGEGQISGWTTTVASREGPTPTAEIRAPDIFSTART